MNAQIEVGTVLSVGQGTTFFVVNIEDNNNDQVWIEIDRYICNKRCGGETQHAQSIQAWIRSGWVKSIGVAIGYGKL